VRTGLPGAVVVVDHFHIVLLANTMLSQVRRRTTAELRGRRGRATDLEWQARRKLLRNREDLSSEQFAKMWNTLLDEGKIGQTLLTAWIARESLRNLWALQYLGPDTPSAPLAPSFVPFLTGLLRYALLVSAGHGERLEADLVRDPGLLLTGPAWAIAVGLYL
jgi:hypothetical protein